MNSSELESSAVSHIGLIRDENQDAVRLPDSVLPPGKGNLFAIADGMGGYAHGGLASRLTLDVLYETYYQNPTQSASKALHRGIDAANLKVYKTSQQLQSGRMGTTLTAACIQGNALHVAHVGDSRLYLVRNGSAICLTNDHTMVGDLVRMHILTPDKVRSHAQRSILTRGIGLTLFIKPEFSRHLLKENDRLVLCSDGLWSMIEDDEFASLARAAPTAERLGKQLTDLALQRDSDDNISCVVIFVRHLAEKRQARFDRIYTQSLHSIHNLIPSQWANILTRNHNGRHRG